MTRIVCMFGTGDAYLVCALARAFERQHGTSVTIAIKGSQLVIPEMFGLPAVRADDEIERAEVDTGFQKSHPNDGEVIYAHPSFVRTPVRVDQLTVKPHVSQADMYRAILGLSPWTPLAEPSWPAPELVYAGATLLIPNARSWPNADPAFWHAVSRRLRERGELVLVADDLGTLDHVLGVAAACSRVVGAQCGLMAIIAERLSCQKTFAVTELEGPLLFGLKETLPYGDPATFAGTFFRHEDVSTYVVPRTGWESIAGLVAEGPCG